MRDYSSVQEPEMGGAGAASVQMEGSPGSSTEFQFGGRAMLINFSIWTLLATLTAANWVFRPVAGFTPPQPVAMAGIAFFQAYLWAALTPSVFWLMHRVSLDRANRLTSGALVVLVGVVASLLVALPVAWINTQVIPPWDDMQSEAQRLWGLTRGRLPLELITFMAVAAAGSAWDYYLKYRSRREETVLLQAHAAQLRADSAQLRAQLSEARLTVLRTQLDPHFLFNTLNAVSALMEDDTSSARRMISRLSELLRHSLRDSTEHEVPLRNELNLLEQYLEIMEIRYHGRLRTSVTIEAGVAEALVPNLILQPLVENAMKHGVGRARGHGRVEVYASRSGSHLTLGVHDSGPGNRAAVRREQETNGIGLRNTRARLTELYGENQSLELRRTPDGGMIAEIRLPYHTGEFGAADDVGNQLEGAIHG